MFNISGCGWRSKQSGTCGTEVWVSQSPLGLRYESRSDPPIPGGSDDNFLNFHFSNLNSEKAHGNW